MATARSSSNPESLDVLTSMVNQTLIETGRFFRSKGSLQSRVHLKKTLPTTYEHFQTALDNLSEQIFLAKAFLEKEYEAVKATKTVNTSTIPEPVVAQVTNEQKEDVTMADSSIVPEGEKPASQAAVSSDSKPPEQPTGEAASKMDIDTKTSPRNATAPKTEPEPSTKAGETQENSQGFPDTGGETLNFNGPNDFDLNLDFGNDDIGNQNFLAGTHFLDSSAANMTGDGTENQGSISSLLPGLESYATNTTDDQFNFDFNKLPGDSGQQQANDQRNNAQDEMALPGESSFDDLFMEKDNFGGDGEDNLLGDNMDLGEIDDSWFQ